MKHESNPDIIAKLKQAQGQIGSILAMMDEGRSCMEFVQQLQAAESIIHLAKRGLVHEMESWVHSFDWSLSVARPF